MMAVEIGKAGEFAFKEQLGRADGAVTLLGHNHLGDIGGFGELFLPTCITVTEFFGCLVLILAGFFAGEIIFLAINEHYNIGILLNRA